MTTKRCPWAEGGDLLRGYHDREWGVPAHEDRPLFEFLVLEGAQAGLSWETILKKREAYRRAFRGFEPERVASFTGPDVDRLLTDAGIVRNRAKIEAAVENARRVLDVQREFGSLSRYLWQFVGGRPVAHRFQTLEDLPTESRESRAMSQDLRRRGFRFVGPTICYAFMQAVGMVNDHLVDCFRYREVETLAEGRE